MKIKSIILSIVLLFVFGLNASASQLPKDIKDYLQAQKTVPTVRNDGLVVYGNDILYIPVIPAYPEKVEKIEIIKTYPENVSINSLPDLILFNNNYSLLKAVRIDANTLTVKSFDELPIEVKTGSIPQDMMVPRGLVFPENLAGILGDVEIPLIGSAKSKTFITKKRKAPLPNGEKIVDTRNYNVPNALKDKLFFVNNFQTEYLQIYSPSVSEPLYSLKTSGVMKDIKSAMGGKYILAASSNKKNIDIIDVNNEYVAKTISLTANPTEITVDDQNKKAYVASIKDESLFVIDLETMKIKEKIQLVGAPHKLALSKDGNKMAYTDMKTSNVYLLDLEHDYENKLITNYPNITKLILGENVIYMISRSQPKLRIVGFDLLQYNEKSKTKKDKKKEKRISQEEQNSAETATEDIITNFDDVKPMSADEELIEAAKMYSTGIKDVEVGTKPVDMVERNGKIYVLSAGNNTVYSYNIETSALNSEKLPMDGFSKSFSVVPDSNLAVITNMADLKYTVYDMDKDKSIQTQPISEYINMITILEKSNER